MADTDGAFIWYELMTPDPAAAKAFYDPVVGWDIEPQPAGELDYRMIRRSDGGNAGGVLRLTEAMTAGGARPAWMGYVSVPDVDAAVAAFEAEGGRAHMPATDMPGVGRIAMVSDPQGAPLYLMKPTPPPGQPDAVSDVFSVDRPQHVRWNELATADDTKALDFYTRCFGWKHDGGMPMGEFGTYNFIAQGGRMIGAVMPLMPGMPASSWSFYFGVDDIDRGAAAIRDAGGTVIVDPMQIPGGEYSLSAADPQGAHFGLVGPRHASGE
ncbi:VOC family protein [Sphingomonas glaciei]|uniref:VOC family protein n=1 Tax=Sphingomonas glaciei TaxID=2938948 RepID=A0ABY5MUH3_9SPHN|nr:VOC family protein [Sphingomonas glaciei]UUR07436.1 VOC family protein [Sphingomonas glaciei]